MPTRRPDKYTEDTEHERTISRNVDDFLEVERGGNKVAASFLEFSNNGMYTRQKQMCIPRLLHLLEIP